MSEDLDFWRFPGVWLGNGDRALGWVGLGAVDFLGGGVVFGIGAMVAFFSSHISHYAITRAGSKWPYPNNFFFFFCKKYIYKYKYLHFSKYIYKVHSKCRLLVINLK